jgi:hypothetical protein
LGPMAGLDGCQKSRLQRDSIPGPSSPYRVAIPTELSRPSAQLLGDSSSSSSSGSSTSSSSSGSNNNNNNLSNLQLGHLLTRSGLTRSLLVLLPFGLVF